MFSRAFLRLIVSTSKNGVVTINKFYCKMSLNLIKEIIYQMDEKKLAFWQDKINKLASTNNTQIFAKIEKPKEYVQIKKDKKVILIIRKNKDWVPIMTEYEELLKLNTEMTKKDEIIRLQEIRIENMIQAILHANKKLFGPSTETSKHIDGQLSLFDNEEKLSKQLINETSTKVTTNEKLIKALNYSLLCLI